MSVFIKILVFLAGLLTVAGFLSLFAIIYVFFYVRNGGEINLRYEEDDEDE